MNKSKYFLVGFWGCFLILRAWLYYSPNSDFDVLGYNIHHLYTGVVILVIALFPILFSQLNQNLEKYCYLGVGVGLSLIIDEWLYLIATDGSNSSYWLDISWYGAWVMMSMVTLYLMLLTYFNKTKQN